MKRFITFAAFAGKVALATAIALIGAIIALKAGAHPALCLFIFLLWLAEVGRQSLDYWADLRLRQ